jgi:hypothetical protein
MCRDFFAYHIPFWESCSNIEIKRQAILLQEVEQPFTLCIRVQRKLETQKVHVYKAFTNIWLQFLHKYEKVKSGDDIVKSSHVPKCFLLLLDTFLFNKV